MSETLVWYAAYGSNVDRRRFMAYLAGGAVQGAEGVEAGARDRTPPRTDEPFRFDRGVRFANHSSRWDGATAYLDHRAGAGDALGRRYLVTVAQLADVVAQENRREPIDLPLHDLSPGEVRVLSDHSYDGLLLIGTDDGTPVVTFTSPSEAEGLDPAPPSAAYLGTMARAIREVHGLGVGEVARLLHRSPGVAPTWSITGIEALAQ